MHVFSSFYSILCSLLYFFLLSLTPSFFSPHEAQHHLTLATYSNNIFCIISLSATLSWSVVPDSASHSKFHSFILFGILDLLHTLSSLLSSILCLPLVFLWLVIWMVWILDSCLYSTPQSPLSLWLRIITLSSILFHNFHNYSLFHHTTGKSTTFPCSVAFSCLIYHAFLFAHDKIRILECRVWQIPADIASGESVGYSKWKMCNAHVHFEALFSMKCKCGWATHSQQPVWTGNHSRETPCPHTPQDCVCGIASCDLISQTCTIQCRHIHYHYLGKKLSVTDWPSAGLFLALLLPTPCADSHGAM